MVSNHCIFIIIYSSEMHFIFEVKEEGLLSLWRRIIPAVLHLGSYTVFYLRKTTGVPGGEGSDWRIIGVGIGSIFALSVDNRHRQYYTYFPIV